MINRKLTRAEKCVLVVALLVAGSFNAWIVTDRHGNEVVYRYENYGVYHAGMLIAQSSDAGCTVDAINI